MSETVKQTPPPDTLINKDEGRRFWQNQEASDNAMIGESSAFPNLDLSQIDLDGSRKFLAKLGIGSGQGLRRVRCALEGGAGIGRFTQAVLLDVAEQVDVIEPVEKFTKQFKGTPGIRNIFNVGLEEWQPFTTSDADGKNSRDGYDLIWNQGCICHLTDAQVVQYLAKCKKSLAQRSPENSEGDNYGCDGLVIVKENLSIRGKDMFDSSDSTVTRENRKYLSLFQQAGLHVIKTGIQRGLPGNFLPVRMYALAASGEEDKAVEPGLRSGGGLVDDHL